MIQMKSVNIFKFFRSSGNSDCSLQSIYMEIQLDIAAEREVGSDVNNNFNAEMHLA